MQPPDYLNMFAFGRCAKTCPARQNWLAQGGLLEKSVKQKGIVQSDPVLRSETGKRQAMLFSKRHQYSLRRFQSLLVSLRRAVKMDT